MSCSYTDIPDPEPKPFEVLIEVKAAGANFNDIWARRGMPGMKVVFPHVAGSDVAGIVRAVGSEVTGKGFGSSPCRWATRSSCIPGISCRTCEMCTSGQEFFCRQFLIWGFQTGPNDGGHSELVTMPAVNVLPKPANLTFEEAASMPLVLETAWRMLGHAGADPGRRARPHLGRRRRPGRDGDPDLPALRGDPDPGGRRRRQGGQGATSSAPST